MRKIIATTLIFVSTLFAAHCETEYLKRVATMEFSSKVHSKCIEDKEIKEIFNDIVNDNSHDLYLDAEVVIEGFRNTTLTVNNEKKVVKKGIQEKPYARIEFYKTKMGRDKYLDTLLKKLIEKIEVLKSAPISNTSENRIKVDTFDEKETSVRINGDDYKKKEEKKRSRY